FIFTRCQYPTFCLRMSNNFAAARDTLKGITNAPANWILLSITMDPGFDTPAVLKRYGETYHYEPANWTFATGSLADISEMGDRFGLIFWREDRGNISHNLRTVVIDPAGRVSKIFDGNNWKPEELVQEILRVSNPANKG
ncbi:MAG TPA: SCO family protein, partial [Clostridia bacterium]|nr:SCO family protein [Clostridia bacterium]